MKKTLSSKILLFWKEHLTSHRKIYFSDGRKELGALKWKMKNPVLQAGLALIANTSVGVKSLSIIVLLSYFLSYSEYAILALSVTPGKFWPPNFWLWTAFTHCFLEIHWWEVVVDISTIVLVSTNYRRGMPNGLQRELFVLFLGRQVDRTALGIHWNDNILPTGQYRGGNRRSNFLLFPLHVNLQHRASLWGPHPRSSRIPSRRVSGS